MASKTRIPNKTQWALHDISAAALFAADHWQALMKIAEQKVDPQSAIHLARLRDNLAEIQRLASDALEGKYQGKGEQVKVNWNG